MGGLSPCRTAGYAPETASGAGYAPCPCAAAPARSSAGASVSPVAMRRLQVVTPAITPTRTCRSRRHVNPTINVTSSTAFAGSALAGRRVVVTGANGFIGAHLVSALVLAGADVVPIVRAATDPWRLAALAPELSIWRADVRALDEPETLRHIRSADVVFHLAAAGVLPGMHSGRELVDHNVAGTLSAMEFAEHIGARRVVICGSCYEYGDVSQATETLVPRPLSEYGATKAAATLIAQAVARRSDMELVVLRPFEVYGPLEDTRRLVPHVMARALAGLEIALGSGRQLRDCIYVDDAVEGFLRAATADGVDGKIFNLCSGVETSIRALAEQIVELAGGLGTLRLGVLPDREPEHWSLTGDPSHAAAGLGFSARTSIADGLARTMAHMPLSLAPVAAAPRAAAGGVR